MMVLRRLQEPLLRHSLWLMAATLVGHVGNYAYHVICGRMMPDSEYGYLMALFSGANLILIPMTALGVTLTRAVRLSAQTGLSEWMRKWSFRLAGVAALILGGAAIWAPFFQDHELSGRAAPLMLAAAIPALNLFLTLTGAGLQGIQAFPKLFLRGSILFVVRALLVGACLTLGFRAAGWAILAHLFGMMASLAFSVWALRSTDQVAEPSPDTSIAMDASDLWVALPVLLSFAVLMSADVILVRIWAPDLSGRFAQAATLGRMILWLPLPIAQAMFPKVVRKEITTSGHRKMAIRAVGYTLLLVVPAFIACWFGAGLALNLMFGHSSPDQINWLRGTALAMMPLAPLHIWIHYELARGKLIRLLPVITGAAVYLAMAKLNHTTPDHILDVLQLASSATLFLCLIAWKVVPAK